MKRTTILSNYNEYFSSFEIKENCLIKDYFNKEKQKPIEQRKMYCHIYCPCSNCNPVRL